MYVENTMDLAWAVRRAIHYAMHNDAVVMHQNNAKYTIRAGNDVPALVKGLNRDDIIISIISGKIIITSKASDKKKFALEIIGQILSEIEKDRPNK